MRKYIQRLFKDCLEQSCWSDLRGSRKYCRGRKGNKKCLVRVLDASVVPMQAVLQMPCWGDRSSYLPRIDAQTPNFPQLKQKGTI